MLSPGPTICLGIPTYLRESVLLDTLEYVFAQTDAPDEIILADQTPQHEPLTSERLGSWHSSAKIRWIKLPEPSLTATRNAILRASSCEYVLFVDDDVILPPDFVASYRGTLVSKPSALLAGGVSDRFNETPAESWRTLSDLEEMLERVRGCNQAVRRDLAQAIGGFDEQFVGPAHGEEMDFAYRLRRKYGPVAYDGSIRLIHLIAPAGGCRVSENHWTDWQKPMNSMLMAFRYPAPLKRWWWFHFLSALGYGPMRRSNRTWRNQPRAWAAFFYAMAQAWKRRRVP